MIAQDIAGSVVFSKERCSGSYTRLRKNRWTFNGKARARAIYELSGLVRFGGFLAPLLTNEGDLAGVFDGFHDGTDIRGMFVKHKTTG